MGLNLHSTVRGAINSVNPDRLVTWLESTGYTTAADGTQTPAYTTHASIDAQIQAATGKDLKHPNLQNVQGVVRSVYMFGNKQGVVRVDAKGGDLLTFAQSVGGAVQTWLVVAVLETWNPDATGWCKVGVVLQVDP